MIWIQVRKPEEIRFANPVADWFKTLPGGMQIFDFDNYSDGFIVDKAIELAANCRKLVILLDADEEETGQVTRFLTRISRNKDLKVLAFLNGKNEMIKKMAKVIAGNRYYYEPDPGMQKEIINDFLNEFKN